MKKLLAVLMILFCSLPLVGCTSARNLSYVNTKISSLYLVADLSESKLSSMTSEEKSAVKSAFETQSNKYLIELKTRYYNALEEQADLGKITSNEKVLLKNHMSDYVRWDENKFIIELKFYSTFASKIFLESGAGFQIENKEEMFCTKTYVSYGQIFSKTPNAIITTTVEDYFNNKIKANLAGIGAESKLGDINYYYLIVSESPIIHATGTTDEVSVGDKSVFCYDSSKELFDFYVVQANTLVYYLLALAITFVFISTYLVVIYFKKDKKEDENFEIE